MKKEVVWFLWHPLGVLWLMFAAAIAGGVVGWVFFDRPPWEGFGAALVLAGVIKVIAYVKGIPAWPLDGAAVRPTPNRTRRSRWV